MGTPIMECRFVKAINDKEEFDNLVRDMAYNSTHKYYNVNACNHSPECRKLTPEEDAEIKKRVMDAVKVAHSEANAKWIY